MEAKVYNQEGKETGTVQLPERVFNVPWNADLVHQVVVSLQANARPRVAHTKFRGEVAGGGAKPWRQKGTGRARHGSIRSPIWRGGGVTFGPRKEKIYAKKINVKMRRKALCAALSRKLRDGELFFVDQLALAEAKTARAVSMLNTLSGQLGLHRWQRGRQNAVLLVLTERDEAAFRSFRNIGNVTVAELRNLTALDVLQHTCVIMVNPQQAVALLERKVQQPAAAA